MDKAVPVFHETYAAPDVLLRRVVIQGVRGQGQTAGRVLVHVETGRASEKLVNQRLAYVAVSRGQYDARIYTDDKVKLARALGRDVSHRSALERTPEQVSGQSADRESSRSESIGHTMAVGSS